MSLLSPLRLVWERGGRESFKADGSSFAVFSSFFQSRMARSASRRSRPDTSSRLSESSLRSGQYFFLHSKSSFVRSLARALTSFSSPSLFRRLMLIGLGGNNGSTLVASILANKHNISWGTKDGRQSPNYIGSVSFRFLSRPRSIPTRLNFPLPPFFLSQLVRASTLRLGVDSNGKDVNIPFSDVLPMV